MKKMLMVVSIIIVLSIIIFVFASNEESNTISEKELNKDKYQKIETDYVTFELPREATHYWMGDGLDMYEVIIHNLSITNNSDYILKVTWYDERYIEETMQIHYNFKNGKLKESDISLNSLSKYDKECLMGLVGDKNKSKEECSKPEDKSKLKFNDFDIELGTLDGYYYVTTRNRSCSGEEVCNPILVSHPIYNWNEFIDIDISNLPPNFLAIDDVNVSACGTLSTDDSYYELNVSSVSSIGSTCFSIKADNIVFNGLGKNVESDWYAFEINNDGWSTDYQNITIKNFNISLITGNYPEAFFTDSVDNLTIRDNYILTTSTESTLKILNIVDSNSKDYSVKIINNTIEKNGSVGANYGIYLENSYNSTIENNTINFSTCSSLCEGIFSNNKYTTISHNNLYLSGSNSDCMYFDSSSNDTISYNVCDRFGTSAAAFFLGVTRDSIISNNNITAYGSAPLIYSNQASDNTFFSNNFNAFGGGRTIHLRVSSDNNMFYNNTLTSNTTSSLLYFETSYNNTFYNNLFNGTDFLGTPLGQYYNTTKKLGTNIFDTNPYIGGNYWTNSSGGYSTICTDSDYDGFCDSPFNLTNQVGCVVGSTCSSSTDYLPLSNKYDSTPPSYSTITTSGTNKTNTMVTFNVTWDNEAQVSWFFEHNQTGALANSTLNSTLNSNNESIYSLNITLFNTQSFVWKFHANDTNGNINSSMPFQTFTVANTIPEVPTLNSPADISSISINYTLLNYTSTDADNETITYHIYNSTDNSVFSLLNTSTSTTYNWTGLLDDTYYWKVKADDGSGNSSNSSSYQFTVSTISPAITLNYPSNNVWKTNLTIEFNFTATDVDNVSECQLWGNFSGVWDKNQTLTSVNSSIKTNFSKIDLVDESHYGWNVWCNDTSNNGGFYINNFTIKLDATQPNSTINSISGTNTINPTLNYNTTDFSIDTCGYWVSRGASIEVTNTTLDCSNLSTIMTVSGNAVYSVHLWANDSAGNLNITSQSFTVDTSSTPSTTGGGGSSTTVIQDVVNLTAEEIANLCGNDICEANIGETPWQCPQDCFSKIWEFDQIFCKPFLQCGNWGESWFINALMFVTIITIIIYVTKAKKAKRLR